MPPRPQVVLLPATSSLVSLSVNGVAPSGTRFAASEALMSRLTMKLATYVLKFIVRLLAADLRTLREGGKYRSQQLLVRRVAGLKVLLRSAKSSQTVPQPLGIEGRIPFAPPM